MDSSRDGLLLESGPPCRLQAWLCLRKTGQASALRTVAASVLLGWVPLVVLSAIQTALMRGPGLESLLTDFSVYARSLVAVPVFILAERSCIPRLDRLIRHFLDAGFVSEPDRPAFERAVASARWHCRNPVVELFIVISAYAVVLSLLQLRPVSADWRFYAAGGAMATSPAGWWHALVSIPLVLVWLFGWFWRLLLWARLLWQVSRLDLDLIAAHPDQSGGLRFLTDSLNAFAPVALAMGAIVAGTVANGVLMQGADLKAYSELIVGHVVLVVCAFAGPLLVFGRALRLTWRRGVLEYGALAERVGQVFARRWLSVRRFDESVLEKPDFSATTDLFQCVSNVHAMKLVLIDPQRMVGLAVVTLLPLVPVVLLSLPRDVLIATFLKLLL